MRSEWIRFCFNDRSELNKIVRAWKWKYWALDCPLAKGNEAPHLKFEIPNGKISESKKFFDLGQELVSPAHLKDLKISHFTENW